ncbi:endonuclease [Chryseotalea sanaruensis]|uniref:Endonuclease n=1 Tax=Chryseotalea sanaruensis TaxID=2482724 RepID=A0A401U7D2_9BACT|nr:endonuclease/exonuclease/phosphatase family protein [Chryseotalea sanaruensis]GCC50802.1 endonuclease [Chryseotalea sanaruensis]
MRILIILSILAATLCEAQSQSLKVMTYNIRLNTTSDGVNSWPNRKEKVATLIKKINPDAFGVQEALHDQMQDLLKALPDYTFVGVGRDDGKEKGEYTAIFYKKSKLKVLKSDSFWLSETPTVPGSKGWDAAITRMVTHAHFKDFDSNMDFLMVTTHFDHVGKQARLMSASYIEGWITGNSAPKNRPAILCGDFNFQPDEEPYASLVKSTNPRLIDARPVADKNGTFCGFEKDKMECVIIDYIFHTPNITIENFEVIQENDGQYYPSDHLPVVATIKLASKD